MAGSTPARRPALTGKGCAARGAIRALGRRSRCCHAGARGATRRSGYNRSARSGGAVKTGTAGGGRGALRRKTRSANPRGGASAGKTGAAGGGQALVPVEAARSTRRFSLSRSGRPGAGWATALGRPRWARAGEGPARRGVGSISSRGLRGLCPCEAIGSALREQVHRVGAVSSRRTLGALSKRRRLPQRAVVSPMRRTLDRRTSAATRTPRSHPRRFAGAGSSRRSRHRRASAATSPGRSGNGSAHANARGPLNRAFRHLRLQR